MSNLQGVAISVAEREGFPSLTPLHSQPSVSLIQSPETALLFRVFDSVKYLALKVGNLLHVSQFVLQAGVLFLQDFDL